MPKSVKSLISKINVFSLFILLLLISISCQQKNDHTDISQLKAKYDEGWKMVKEIEERISTPKFKSKDLSILEHGISGDSITDNHEKLNQLIVETSRDGGGTLVFPKGQYYFDGPIHLKDNINIHLEEGARLYFSSNPDSYLPAVKVRWEGTVCYNYSPLIYGYQLKNIAITGDGVIDGAALEWSREWRENQNNDKDVLRKMGNDQEPEIKRVFANGFLDLDGDGKDDGYGDGQQHFLRPSLVELYECEGILLKGITFMNSPFWTIHPVFSKNITIDGIKVYGETVNDDGIDPDSSEDVLIQNCEIKTHDDAIAIKAGRDQDAWDRPGSKNIIIRKNQLLSGVNALCIGSEMSGGVENVFAFDNVIKDGRHALNFKCNLDRGGVVKNIYIKDIYIASCEEAMFIFRMDYHGYRGNHFPTKFNNFFVSDIKCDLVDGTAFKIVGVEDAPIQDIYLENIQVKKAGVATEVKYTQNIIFSEVYVNDKVIQ